MIVDAQVHAYAAPSSRWPWADESIRPDPPEVNAQQLVAAMEAVGVDRAILVSTWVVYRTDTRFAESVYREHPDRFRLVAPINPTSPRVAERVAEWAGTPGAVGVRLFFLPNAATDAEDPGVVATVSGASAAGMAVNIHCWSRLEVVHNLARAFPDAQLVIDHLGLPQPFSPPAAEDALADLESLLALARHPNVAVKLTGVCTYSHRPFPFEDLWEPIGRVIDTFGVDRCMWGTDWQRTTQFLTYEEGVRAFRDHWPMSGAEKAALMGATAARIYRWPLRPDH